MTDNFRLVLDPDSLLYTKLNDLDLDKNYDLKLIESAMVKIMAEHGGIGISANQVGFRYRAIVVKPQGRLPIAMFNPKVIDYSNTNTLDKEGCLSFPGLFLSIHRSDEVTVEYIDTNKKPCIITLKDYDARCLQHELDHLDGTCFTNKVSNFKLELARKKQRKLENGRTK